ncbi:MAG: hypothetical protein U0411_00035 [Thermodesulfovibrionales bacterium]
MSGLVGVQAIKALNAMGNADFVIKMTYVFMLGIVGTHMFIESLQSMRKRKDRYGRAGENRGLHAFSGALPADTLLEKSGVTHSVLVPLFFGGFVGFSPRSWEWEEVSSWSR